MLADILVSHPFVEINFMAFLKCYPYGSGAGSSLFVKRVSGKISESDGNKKFSYSVYINISKYLANSIDLSSSDKIDLYYDDSNNRKFLIKKTEQGNGYSLTDTYKADKDKGYLSFRATIRSRENSAPKGFDKISDLEFTVNEDKSLVVEFLEKNKK